MTEVYPWPLDDQYNSDGEKQWRNSLFAIVRADCLDDFSDDFYSAKFAWTEDEGWYE